MLKHWERTCSVSVGLLLGLLKRCVMVPCLELIGSTTVTDLGSDMAFSSKQIGDVGLHPGYASLLF